MVGFGSAEFGCEWTECFGLDGAVGFVDDDELPRLEGGVVAEVVVPPFRGVLGGDPEIVGQDLGGDRGGGETDDGTGLVFGCPGAAQRVYGGGLARPRGAGQDVEHTPGCGDAGQGVGLAVAEYPPIRVRSTGGLLDCRQRHRWPGEVVGVLQ